MRSPIIFRIFKDNQLVGVKQFDQDQIVIGQSADVQLHLEGEGISPIHSLVELRDKGYYLCDLGSQNGTFKNGQAVLDEAIVSGDEITIGPFKLSFFVGVPKPTSVPVGKPEAPKASEAKTPAAIPTAAPTPPPAKPPASEPMPPASAVKTEEVRVVPSIPAAPLPKDEKPAITTPAVKPEIKTGKDRYKKAKKTKTFAPASEVSDLRRHLKPGKGPVLQVAVAWKERVLTTHHFKGKMVIRTGSGKKRVAVPDGLLPRGFALIEMAGAAKINILPEVKAELVSSTGALQSMEELSQSGKAQRNGQMFSLRLDQNEMICLTLPGGYLTLYIRYVPQTPVVPMLPPMMLSGSEMTGVIMAILMVGILALYVSATTPKEYEQVEQEEVQHIAQVIFNKPPTPPPPPREEPPPPPPQKTPPPPPKKVVVADKERESQKKGPAAPKAQANKVAARANEVAPKPNSRNRRKTFTSTRQGGAVKTGETAGANAQSSNKDVSKIGLFSAFGGGGSRAKIDQAYSGAGEVIGMADKATGTAGFNEDRAGDDLGSKFRDTGAGGRGTSTQGIAGIGTKGRSGGTSAYGAADGLGGKTTVAIEGGGAEESFDGSIDKEAIRRVIRANLHEVKSCYERVLNTLARGRRLEGKVVLGWDIVARGQARNVKIKSSTLNNKQVENCIRARLASWTFPEPPAGLVAEVQAYPFVLNQSN